MSESNRERFKLDLADIGDKLKELIEAGNARRLIVRKDEHVIAEFPLTAAVVGAVIAPVLAAIGAIAALVSDCTIEVERTDEKP
jgi:hypothetical protein